MRNASAITSFLRDRALPLWASTGFDFENGSFVERLDAIGAADFGAPKRLRVQARQIYVYAHATMLGLWPEGSTLALRAFEFIDRHGRASDRADGFIHSVTREGQQLDTRCDSYDHAFLLFAFSWLYRATGEVAVRRAMDDVTATIDTHLALPGGGVAVDAGADDDAERQQNPNMHLFEAWLAAAEATGEAQFLARADAQAELFERRLFDADAGVLREFYTADWSPAAGARGAIVEPGHHCEWLWLLKRHADAHRRPVGPEAMRLGEFVDRHGRPGGGILLCDQVTPDGLALQTNTRIWPQTEAIKAEIALAEIRGDQPAPRTDMIVEALFAQFIDRPLPGAWVDWIDPAGAAIGSTIPASTFYHVFLAFSEYLAAASR